jgi:hypothetical protein
MDIHPQIEPTSTARILTCMSLAIDETKLLRSINQSKLVVEQLEAVNPSSHRLIFLKKEISNLETRLIQVRSKARRMRTITNLTEIK